MNKVPECERLPRTTCTTFFPVVCTTAFRADRGIHGFGEDGNFPEKIKSDMISPRVVNIRLDVPDPSTWRKISGHLGSVQSVPNKSPPWNLSKTGPLVRLLYFNSAAIIPRSVRVDKYTVCKVDQLRTKLGLVLLLFCIE